MPATCSTMLSPSGVHVSTRKFSLCSCGRLRERGDVKLGVLQNRKPHPPADGCHVDLLEHQLANLLPMRTELTLLAYRGHIFARFQNCAQHAASAGSLGAMALLARN